MDIIITLAAILGYFSMTLATLGFIFSQIEDVPKHQRIPDWLVLVAGFLWPVTLGLVLLILLFGSLLDLGYYLGGKFK